MTYTHTHTLSHTHPCTHTHSYVCAHTHAHTHTHTHNYVHTFAHTPMHTHTHTHTYMYIRSYTHPCTHTHTHTGAWFEMADSQNHNIYVSGLPLDISLEEFNQLMTKYGIIMEDEDGGCGQCVLGVVSMWWVCVDEIYL